MGGVGLSRRPRHRRDPTLSNQGETRSDGSQLPIKRARGFQEWSRRRAQPTTARQLAARSDKQQQTSCSSSCGRASAHRRHLQPPPRGYQVTQPQPSERHREADAAADVTARTGEHGAFCWPMCCSRRAREEQGRWQRVTHLPREPWERAGDVAPLTLYSHPCFLLSLTRLAVPPLSFAVWNTARAGPR